MGAITVDDLVVDPKFESALRRLTAVEYAGLSNRISKEGRVRNPLSYWLRDSQAVLIDGHHRFAIYHELTTAGQAIEMPPLVELTFGSDAEAKTWIEDEHKYRRNLTAAELQAMCDEVAPKIVEEAKKKQRKHGRTAPGKKKRNTCANTAQVFTPKPKADQQIQDAVEEMTGQRPPRQMARNASQKARGRKKTVKVTQDDRDFGYKPKEKGTVTKYQRLLDAAVAMGRVKEGQFWRELRLKQDRRQWFYDLCFEMPHVRFVTQAGFVEVTLEADAESFDWVAAIRHKIDRFMEDVDGMDTHLQYNHSVTTNFVAEMRQLLAPMPDPDR